MKFAEVKAKLQEAGIDEMGLDSMVDEAMQIKASEINNEGFDAQLSFLLKEFDAKYILNNLV
jgi:hypothetical protein